MELAHLIVPIVGSQAVRFVWYQTPLPIHYPHRIVSYKGKHY